MGTQIATTDSHAMSVYEKVDPISFVNEMATAYGAMAGARNESESRAVALTCMIEGMTPMQFGRKYHLIKGKPSPRADYLLAAFRIEYGGKHQVIESSPERAAISLTYEGVTTEFEFTWEEAKESRWPWINPRDHSEGLKDNWSTPTDRRDMLWSRLVSSSLKKVCPEVSAGLYTPEEMMDLDYPSSGTSDQKPAFKTIDEIVQEGNRSSDPEEESGEIISSEVVEDAVNQESASEEQKEDVDGRSTGQQRRRIRELYELCEVSEEKQQATLAKRGVESLMALSFNDAEEILGKLEAFAKSLGK